jgi:hypothetical protein
MILYTAFMVLHTATGRLRTCKCMLPRMCAALGVAPQIQT